MNTAALRPVPIESPKRSVYDSSRNIPYWWRQSAQNSGIAPEWLLYTKSRLKPLTVHSRLTLSALLTQPPKKYKKCGSRVTNRKRCLNWRHQYPDWRHQTLLSGDSGGTRRGWHPNYYNTLHYNTLSRPLSTSQLDQTWDFNPFYSQEWSTSIFSFSLSPEIYHTVWRTWHLIACSNESWLNYQFSLHHWYICSWTVRRICIMSLGAGERVKQF